MWFIQNKHIDIKTYVRENISLLYSVGSVAGILQIWQKTDE